MARASEASMPHSVLRANLLAMLKKHHFIADFTEDKDERLLKVKLNPASGSIISDVRLYSTPGRHLYSKSASLPWGKFPHSLIIISTPQGLMSQRQAAAKKIGGELIAEVY